MNNKEYCSYLRGLTKVGSFIMDKKGNKHYLTDFERGICMGRYKQICDNAIYLKNKSSLNNDFSNNYKNKIINRKSNDDVDSYVKTLKNGFDNL